MKGLNPNDKIEDLYIESPPLLKIGWLSGSCVSPARVRRGGGPHYGPARRKFIIGMGTQNADLTGAMGVSGDSINKPSGV